MTARRPWRIEVLAEHLVPPAAAEHVLGDLAECSPTAGRYAANLASILPRIVWSQIRRRATVGGLVFNALLSGFALLVAQGALGGAFLSQPGSAVRLAVPWAIWIAGCALAAAYGPRDKPFTWNSRLFFLTAAVAPLAAFALDVPVLRVAAALGGTFAVSFVLSMPFATAGVPPPLSPDTLLEHARLFQRGIWWRNLREQVAAAFVIVWLVRDLMSATGGQRWGPVLLLAGLSFIIAFLYLRAHPRRVPETSDLHVLREFHRRELARQRDILRAVPLWYLLPFVPGFAAMTIANWQTHGAISLAGVAGVAVMFGMLWALNNAGAKFLDGQRLAVEALSLPDAER